MQGKLTQENWIVAGASRGLGRAFIKATEDKTPNTIRWILSSRNEKALENLCSQLSTSGHVLPMDFSKPQLFDSYLKSWQEYKPHRIFYFAGGGPFGLFSEKEWKDHQWAFAVNFEFPAYLLHQKTLFSNLKQIVLIGSAVAENQPDPKAASYSASKHALKGLVTTLQAEDSAFDIRLYSPGYMDTDMLPPNAKPRQNGEQIQSPHKVADQLLHWCLNSSEAKHHQNPALS